MPRTLQDTLSHRPTEVLRDLARAHRIDRGRQAERTLLIETLLSLPDPEAVVVEADRRRMEYRLGRLRPRQLRDLGERHRVSLHGLKKKWDLVEALASAPDAATARSVLERAREALFHGSSIDDTVLRDLVRASEGAHSREAERIRDHLALTRDAIREAANLGASIALAEDAWKRGADFLDR